MTGCAGSNADVERRAFRRMKVWRHRQNERPVRGDNRTGQAIQALGVDGRSRRIQPRWGGITAPTYICRQRVAERSKRPAIFFNFFGGLLGDESWRGGPISPVNRRF